jgi:hypothetical protein
VGLVPGHCPRLFQNNMLNEIWIFNPSWSFGLYALTAMWDKIWATDVVVSAEALQTSATEWRAPDWTGMHALVLGG